MKNNVLSNPNYRVEKAPHRNTVKVIHIASGDLYSVHPADQAIVPLRSWLNKHNN